MNYPTHITIQYIDDYEYRSSIRQLFNMSGDNSLLSVTDDVDPVSLDENNYDPAAAQKILDYVYTNTKTHPIFKEIYTLAAGFMFSENEEIGLAVLFSYDYLAVFHPCICVFFETPDQFTHYHPLVKALAKKIGLKKL